MAQCTDCDARIEYQGNGSQRAFTFPFEYIETTDVKVTQYDDKQLKYVDLTYGTDWRFLNPTTVELDTPPTTNLVVYRCTDIDQMQAAFHPGHSVKADDLNTDFNQLRLAIEEGRCTSGNILEELEESKELFLNRINVDETKAGYKGDLVKSNSDLTINDEVVATTQWIDNRYWDQCDETTYLEDTWIDEIDDAHIPTTGAVEARLVELVRKGGFGLPSVVSVNGKAGIVQLDAADVGALPDTYVPPAAPVNSVNSQTGDVSLGLGDLTDVETSSAGHIPTDGQALVWNAGMNHWMPETISSGGDSGVPEAPTDGRQYGRQNNNWTEIISTGGGGGDSGLWQQSGTTLEPVDGADNLRVPGTITGESTASFTGNITAGGYALAQLPALPA